MGTKSLTVVVHNHEVKFAQYGQFDGYPEYLGVTLLNFFRNSSNMELLKAILPKMRLWNENDQKLETEFLKSIGCEVHLMNKEQKKLYQKKYALQFLERYGRLKEGELLKQLLKFSHLAEIVTMDSYEFAKDNVFCSWAYVIDMDKKTLEVYKGFNQTKLTPKDRFFSLYEEQGEFYPVIIVANFLLSNLPDEDEFIYRCKQEN